MDSNKNKHIRFAQAGMILMTLTLLAGIVSAQSFSTFFSDKADIVIVTGADAAQSDRDTANMIARSIEDENDNTNVRIMTDDNVNAYIESSISNDNTNSDVRIISVGGSCVNKLTAAALGLNYPSCGSEFMRQTNAGPGEYLVQTEGASVLNTEGNASGDSLTITVVAGYNAADTLNSASTLNSTNIEFETGQSEVLASTSMSANGSANVGANLSGRIGNSNSSSNNSRY